MMGIRVRWIGESNGFENRYDGIYIKERKKWLWLDIGIHAHER